MDNIMRPKYSVVMVTYNHENYIKKALESVLIQSEINDVEILIGDDGSSDNTVEILHEYENRYDFIHVYAHENEGLSKNVYDLFLKAKGEYIAVLEGDDYWIDNEKLKKQKLIIDKNNCVATACNSLKVDNEGNKLGYWNDRTQSKLLSKGEVLFYQTKICHPSAVMFKNLFYNSADKYDVIAKASRMGGNHSGLINLLANNGGIYLDVEAMTVWRFIQVDGGKNYSSQKVDNIENYYASMKKYEMYDRAFELNYQRNIYDYYHACKRVLKKEVISNIGVKRYYCAKIQFLINKLIVKMGIRKY
jgi:Glycosyltransferases involved in cell wall biogenesis